LNEVEDEDDHCDDQKDVDEAAANICEQAEKPENGDDNSDPKQHENLLHCFSFELLIVQAGAAPKAGVRNPPLPFAPGPHATSVLHAHVT
jgi:hypothetical protein